MLRYASAHHSSSDFAEAILQASADGVVVVDSEGLIVRCNPRAEELMGRPAEELVGSHFGTVSNPTTPGGSADVRLLHADGSARVVELRTARTTWKGSPVTVVSMRDMTRARDQAQSLRMLTAALEAAENAVQIADSSGRVEWVNPAFSRTTGYPAADVVGRTLQEVAELLGQQEVFLGTIEPSLQRGESWQGQLTGRHRNGRPFREERTITPVMGPSGTRRSFISVSTDISDRLEAQEQRERLLSIVEATPSLVGIAGRDGRVRFINRAGRRLLGLHEDDELDELRLEDIHPPEVVELIYRKGIPEAVRRGVWEGETAIRGPGGRETPMWQIILSHRSADGRLEYFSTVGQDLSRWKAAEAALKERVKELRTLYGVSRELAQSQRPLEERLARVVEILPPGWLYPSIAEARITWGDESFATPGFRETPWMLSSPIRPGGWEAGRVEVALTEERAPQDEGEGPFLSEERELLDAVAAAIGEAAQRDKLQQEFVGAQKMETIGRLAGGAAHDFNNLLSVIRAHADTILGDLPPDSAHVDDLSRILRATEQGAVLTAQLLAFSRKQTLEESVVRLPRLIQGLEPSLRRLIPATVELHVEAAPETPAIRVDPAKLDQVLLNLVINAVDAIHGEGRVTLRVDRETLSAREAAALADELPPGPYATLTVVDTGSGMSPEVATRVFEPFFTTKPEGKGTGLGLSMAFGFVRQSRGHIEVKSAPGAGTALVLRFPAVTDEEVRDEAPPQPSRNPPATLRGVRVLLVDDDERVRRALHRMLSQAGLEIRQAASGPEALALDPAVLQATDLLMTDLVMPSMSGIELTRRLRRLHPHLGVVLMSGYAPEELRSAVGGTPEGEAHDAGAPPAEPFHPEMLSKPFSMAEAAAAIRRALN